MPSLLSTKKGKSRASTYYDRDIVCLPHSYPSVKGRYAIPRKDTRANLAASGLIGKVRLSSDMDEGDIMTEIQSVFSAPMGFDEDFPFTLLQRCGPGLNSLMTPSLSTSFSWTAKEIIKMAGQGCIYIKADCELKSVKKEVQVRCAVLLLCK